MLIISCFLKIHNRQKVVKFKQKPVKITKKSSDYILYMKCKMQYNYSYIATFFNCCKNKIFQLSFIYIKLSNS